jgi:hypothetical protein
MSQRIIGDEDRYWVQYRLNGDVAVLYKRSLTGLFFTRWSNGEWIDAADRYLRVTRDAACDEVSLESAVELMKTLG